MDFFPEDIKEAAEKAGNEWIKAGEFTDGLVLQLAKPLEKVSGKYGATESDHLFKTEQLEKGQSFRYTFNTPEGVERKLDSKSAPFFFGFKSVEELGVGDWVKITRTGKTKEETRYDVVKTEAPGVMNATVAPGAAPVSQPNEYPKNDLTGGTDL